MTEIDNLPQFVRVSQLIGTGPYKGQRPIVGVTRQTVYNWMKQGLWPQPIRVGRSLMWTAAQVREALTRMEQGTK